MQQNLAAGQELLKLPLTHPSQPAGLTERQLFTLEERDRQFLHQFGSRQPRGLRNIFWNYNAHNLLLV
jgi:hypothetical protein